MPFDFDPQISHRPCRRRKPPQPPMWKVLKEDGNAARKHAGRQMLARRGGSPLLWCEAPAQAGDPASCAIRPGKPRSHFSPRGGTENARTTCRGRKVLINRMQASGGKAQVSALQQDPCAPRPDLPHAKRAEHCDEEDWPGPSAEAPRTALVRDVLRALASHEAEPRP